VAPEPFIFGKVPQRGDFVRAGALGPLVDELDEWLQRAVMALRGRPAGEEPVAFVMGRPSGILLGALRPSRDKSGRVFPLAAGGFLPGALLTGAELNSRGPFLNAARATAEAVVAGQPLDVATAGMRVPPFPSGHGGLVPALVFGAVPVESVAISLATALVPLTQTPTPKYGLGLPLPADPARRAAGAAYWLDAVGARTRERPAVTMLWDASSEGARLAYFAGPATADALSYITTHAPADGVFDVDAAPPAAPGATTLGAMPARS
jgi:type VI secretion system protein ImpM